MKLLHSNLTIVLLLKDRHEFTERFLNYFNQKNINFKLVISDGSKKKIKSSLFNKIKKNKLIKYLKFPEDKSYELFYKKVFKTVKYVQTKYIIFAANDDFFIYENLEKCLNYLKSNKNIIGAGGLMIGFKINKVNKKNKLENLYTLYDFIKLDHDSSKTRFDTFIKKFSDLPRNCIMKKDALIQSYKIASNNFKNNIEFKDHFTALHNVISGKIKIFKIPLILHEDHKKGEASNRATYLEKVFLDKNFLKDLRKFDFILSNKSKFKKNYVSDMYYNYVLKKFLNKYKLISEPGINEIKNIIYKKIKRKIIIKKLPREPKINLKFSLMIKDTIKFIENKIIN